jgi:hypothetical protein
VVVRQAQTLWKVGASTFFKICGCCHLHETVSVEIFFSTA